MSSITPISNLEKRELSELHDVFACKVKLTGCSTLAASFLIIGALIVIGCGSLCLLLPGVNVINHVILPAVVPGILAILISLPLILLAVKYNQEKNFVRKEMIDKMLHILDKHGVPENPRQTRVKFILKNFLNWGIHPDAPHKLLKNTSWMDQYQTKILADMKERLGKDKKDYNPRQKKIAAALDKATGKITQQKRSKD